MRNWNLNILTDPVVMLLAADYRLTTTNYTNDHIWELLAGRGEPAALVLQTSYGLRARNMRIFPIFETANQIIQNPAEFAQPPVLKQFYPNYLQLEYHPIEGIQIIAEYWAPESNLLAGRIQINNISNTEQQIKMELAAVLNPTGSEGQAMLPTKKEAVNVLQGKSESLSPVLFMTGGPKPLRSPYTSLVHDLQLLRNATRRFTWVLASGPDPDENFRTARQTATRNWSAELARIAMTNSSRIDVETGNPDWDSAFAFGQNTAHLLIHSPNKNLPRASFVNTRMPDQGHSPKGDGSDYSHLWEGQTALHTWYLLQNLLPGNPEVAKGLLLNFIATQQENGKINFKPGLGGQRSPLLATPILASTAWRIYEYTLDKDFIEDVFPRLLDFVHFWFDSENDRDGDGIPEWANLLQTGFDDNPSFARWVVGANGADITTFESPDLCAFLVRECDSLIEMANLVGQSGAIPPLEAWRDNLASAVRASWDARNATFHYWDRDSHRSPKGEVLGKRKGPGEIDLDIVFELPHRIMLQAETKEQSVASTHLFLNGQSSNGEQRSERFGQEQLHWLQNKGVATSQGLYAELENAQIEGLPSSGKASIHVVDYSLQDQSLLVPLWAGIPDNEQTNKIIKRKLNKTKEYLRPYGIPAVRNAHKKASSNHAVWLPWNTLIGEGLVRYNARSQAADLYSRLMVAIISSLKKDKSFRKQYMADTLQGIGERNELSGLPPLGLFLEILGVRIISPYKVYLHGSNRFSFPVKLKYIGLTIICEAKATHITFPNGKAVTIDQPGKWMVNGNLVNQLVK